MIIFFGSFSYMHVYMIIYRIIVRKIGWLRILYKIYRGINLFQNIKMYANYCIS